MVSATVPLVMALDGPAWRGAWRPDPHRAAGRRPRPMVVSARARPWPPRIADCLVNKMRSVRRSEIRVRTARTAQSPLNRRATMCWHDQPQTEERPVRRPLLGRHPGRPST
jgi:hypothetical protein